jgi:hypothetical protein
MNQNLQNQGGTGTARAQETPPQQHQPDQQRGQQPFRGGQMQNATNKQTDNFVELKYRSTKNLSTVAFARALGWFSIGLGLAEILMPRQLGELAGVGRSHRAMLPALGFREIAHGLGIMQSAKPTTAVWTRVGGDALDLAYVGASFVSDDSNKRRLIGTTIALLGVTALDILCAQRLSSQNWQQVKSNPNAPETVGQSSGRRAFIA